MSAVATPPPAPSAAHMNVRDELRISDQRQAAQAILQAHKVHIRVQQRARKKNVTTVQGLDQDLNFRRICREMRQNWGCNGSVIETPEAGKVIQLQGNFSEKMRDFLLRENMATEENLEIHSL